eukprot:TRINITY_DN22919_c0_g1_i1.p1 TRINITY_DN22919_c0_g1~~TRINITY_DN22919_c0_g1_i1.p1  ORF type:complete len:304 (-),score=42.12 TRINITY_DN22919_c0_g1_i1:480-1391(-)
MLRSLVGSEMCIRDRVSTVKGQCSRLHGSPHLLAELNDFVNSRPWHDLTWSHCGDRPAYARTAAHGSGYQSKILDTAGHSNIANERAVRIELNNREPEGVIEQADRECDPEDPDHVSQRMAQVFGPRPEMTQGSGSRAGFNPAPTKGQLKRQEFAPYLAANRAHHQTPFQYISRGTAWRAEKGMQHTVSTAVPPHRMVDDSKMEIPQGAEYHKQAPNGPVNRDLYHNWVCPGRLAPDCFNYYEHPSADHPQHPLDADLTHNHSGSGHPEAPGCKDVSRITVRENRRCLMHAGSNLITTGRSPF